MMFHDRGVLTMAYGSSRYLEMAKSLARSLRLHSPRTCRAVVTDSSDDELQAVFDVCVPLNRELGRGNQQKLHLDRYTPFRQTIFIDSDCLAVRDIDEIWGRFKHVPFGIPGDVRLRRGDRDPKMNVDFLLNHYKLAEVSKFNSGLIYFDSSEQSAEIFGTARALLSRYKELGFSRPENPYDEPVFAVAMALHGLSAVPDEGRVMRTPVGLRGRLRVDVCQGIGVFNKYGVVVEPAVIHFSGRHSSSFEYRRECWRLQGLKSKRNPLREKATVVWLWLLTWLPGRALKLKRHMRIRARSSSAGRRLLGVLRGRVVGG